MKRWIMMTTLTAAFCLGLYGIRVQAEQRAIAGQIIRLHVKASSDSAYDQALKLRVRDAVLPQIGRITANCEDREEAEQALERQLPMLGKTALQVLHESDPGQELAISLGSERFPTRSYETFSLPAGTYRCLRLTLGRGAGHNWWCVAFPALCLPATAEGFEDAALSAGLSSEQRDLMTGEQVTVKLKFRVLEWLQELFD